MLSWHKIIHHRFHFQRINYKNKNSILQGLFSLILRWLPAKAQFRFLQETVELLPLSPYIDIVPHMLLYGDFLVWVIQGWGACHGNLCCAQCSSGMRFEKKWDRWEKVTYIFTVSLQWEKVLSKHLFSYWMKWILLRKFLGHLICIGPVFAMSDWWADFTRFCFLQSIQYERRR